MTLSVRMPLLTFYDLFYQPAHQPGDPRRASCEVYRQHIRMLGRYWREQLGHAEDLTLADLSDELVVGCMNWDVTRGLSRSTANGRRRHINAIWKFAARKAELRGLLALPENQRYRELLAEPIALLPEEFQRVLAAAKAFAGRLRGPYGWVSLADFMELFVRLSFNCGGRVSAMRGIPTANLDLARGEALVPASVQKHKRDQRVRLFPSTIAVLRRMRLVERGVPTLLGDWPYNTNTLRRYWSRLLVAAGLFDSVDQVPRTLKLHAIRKTFASTVAAAHGEHVASRLLQHSSVTVTQRYIDRRYLSDPSVPDLIADPVAHEPPPALRVVREEAS